MRVYCKPGAEHPVIDKYLKWMQSKCKPFMHVREAGEFGAGFSVVITGWPKETRNNMMKGDVKKFGEMMTKGDRTKTHTDYDAGRGTSYSCCTAMQDDALGILVNAKGEEKVISLPKARLSSSRRRCFTSDATILISTWRITMSYPMKNGRWMIII